MPGIAARTWAKTSGDAIFRARRPRFSLFQAGVTEVKTQGVGSAREALVAALLLPLLAVAAVPVPAVEAAARPPLAAVDADENFWATAAKGTPCCICAISCLAPSTAAGTPPARVGSIRISLIW